MTTDAFPPQWASRWGDDECGLWADLVVKGVAQRMRRLLPGEFLMGSSNFEEDALHDEKRQHLVRISRAFWIADTPCTQALWKAVTGKNPSHFVDPTRPVERISWNDATTFTLELEHLLANTADVFLPTEAQWEFACRAGGLTPFNLGGALDSFAANIAGGQGKTVPVKSYSPNVWGLFDCHGQVWEWCADGYRSYPAASNADELHIDPLGPTGNLSDALRVLRGGSWINPASRARSAARRKEQRGHLWVGIGFRFAVSSSTLVAGEAKDAIRTLMAYTSIGPAAGAS
jgi:formylglycine-generating enzyme